MDSTRAIPSSKHSTFLSSSQKGSSLHCYNNCQRNTGGMFTIGNANGGQILMNSHDINMATHLQFSPPTRSKSTNISHGSAGKSNCSTSDHRGGSMYTTTTTTTTVAATASAPIIGKMPVCQGIGKGIIVDTMATKKILSAVIRQQKNNCSTIMRTTFMTKFPTEKSLKLLSDDKGLFIERSSTHANYYQTKPTSSASSSPNRNANFNGDLRGSPNDGNKLVNSIKSFFSAIIRPIIDTTSLISGNDTKPEFRANGIGQTANHTDFVSGGGCGNSCNFKNQNSNPKNITLFYGNQMNRHSPTSDMMDNVPFFDCDDFIEGGEDQVDFVADSTKFEWQHANHHSNARNFDDLIVDEVKARSLSKENIFYDCMPPIGMDSPINQQQPQIVEQQQIQQHIPVSKVIESSIDKSMVIDESVWKPRALATDNDKETIESDGSVAGRNSLKKKIQTKIDGNQKPNDHNVKYVEENDKNELKPKRKPTTKSIINNTPKLDAVIPNRHSNRRRKHKQNNKRNNNKRTNDRSNYCNKNTASYKNRHEKSRHELEMNIHDDIDEIFSSDLPNLSATNSSLLHRNHTVEASEIDEDGDDDGDDIDLEIIDVDTIRPTTSSALNIQSKSSNELNASTSLSSSAGSVDHISTISPETISSGCIFTKFFRFDNSKCSNKPKSLPYRLAQKLMPSQMRSMQTERNLSMCRTSETESDDSFIVFEEHSPNNSIKGCYSRQRQLSDCSDDFIFFERDDDDDTDEDDYTDSTDDDETDESESESDNESVCSVIFEKKRRDDCNQPDSGFEEKKVSFNLCPKVHEIRVWKFAYSAARKGEWEQIYRDRKRFENRINDLNRVIAPVLAVEHRQKIFDRRFKEPIIQPQQSQSLSQSQK